MLKLEGIVQNVYKAPDFSKDGTTTPGAWKVQLMYENRMSNGEVRMDLATISIENPDLYTIGETAEVPVGVFARGGQIQFFGVKK